MATNDRLEQLTERRMEEIKQHAASVVRTIDKANKEIYKATGVTKKSSFVSSKTGKFVSSGISDDSPRRYCVGSVRFDIIAIAPEYIVIKDIGPWDKNKTITNGISDVFPFLNSLLDLNDRPLYVIDSAGDIDRVEQNNRSMIGFIFHPFARRVHEIPV